MTKQNEWIQFLDETVDAIDQKLNQPVWDKFCVCVLHGRWSEVEEQIQDVDDIVAAGWSPAGFSRKKAQRFVWNADRLMRESLYGDCD